MRTRNSSELELVLQEATDIAHNVGQTLSTTHVLLALYTVPNAAEILLRERGVDEDRVLDAVKRIVGEGQVVIDDLVSRAHTLARQTNSREASCLHLLVGILRTREIAAHRILARAGLDIVATRNQAMRLLTDRLPRRYRTEPPPRPPRQTPGRDRGRFPGRRTTPKPSAETIEPGPGPSPGRRRWDPGAEPEEQQRRESAPEADGLPAPEAGELPEESFPLLEDGAPGPHELDPEHFPWLTSLGRNLTALAHQGAFDPLVGREKEVEEVIDILGKRRTNNPVLVGEPGVGKTAIVEGLALSALELGERAGPIGEKILIELDMASILAGTHLRGSFSEKLNGIKDEVRLSEGRVVVFIDEIHTLIGAGATGDGPQDAANELKAALSRGEFPCIGATTHDEYRKFIESDAALERRFTPVLVPEPSVEDTCRILEGIIERYEAHHRVPYQRESLEAAARLAERYVSDRCLPDKAIAVIDLAGSRARRQGDDEVTPEHIARVISKTARVPEERLLLTDQERLLEMEDALAEKIIGHREVLQRVAEVVRRNYAGFDSHRPMGSFLLLGPTGVGKTELAKALGDFLYGGPEALIRVDMSEFGEPNTVARLIGSPPGYVGHEEGGQLTEAVRRRPFCVLLLDEIEKAHRDVLQLLLQVLDEGHLTDGRGRQVSFTHTVILMTSNLGASAFAKAGGRVGFGAGAAAAGASESQDRALELARKSLPPELWNRIDERLTFAPLSQEEVRAVARLLLGESSRKLAADREIHFEASEAVITHLLGHGGFDVELGARPMRQTIQRLVEAPLADRILRGEIERGLKVAIEVSAAEDELTFTPLPLRAGAVQ